MAWLFSSRASVVMRTSSLRNVHQSRAVASVIGSTVVKLYRRAMSAASVSMFNGRNVTMFSSLVDYIPARGFILGLFLQSPLTRKVLFFRLCGAHSGHKVNFVFMYNSNHERDI